ncbi:MAG TPA: hypothetical protein VJ891_13915 [Casimicrobiaceae bacterium]|nr:hypothetical protein [Casimicrobiaceae bacterium]
MKLEYETAVALAELLGHSLAAAIGFCALVAISVIPILALRLLVFLGASELSMPLKFLEQLLLLADVSLFAVTFLSGLAAFTADTVAAARRRIRAHWREDDDDE